jgi:predicted porin
MKKPMLLLSATLFTGLASAQSSLTMFGLLDVTLSRSTGSIASKNQLTQGSWGASRLGFRGTEDLGGGLAASFWIEAAVFPDTGTGGSTDTNNQPSGVTPAQGLTFNRRSTVSLLGNFGEIRVGRDFTPTFWNLNYGDVFISSGAGQAINYANSIVPLSTVGVRVSNSVSYWLPKNAFGITAQATHYFGENPSNVAGPHDGSGNALRLGYDGNGAFMAGIAYGRTTYASGDAVQRNVFVGYRYAEGGKVVAEFSRDSLGTLDATGGAVGATYTWGAHLLRAAYSWYGNDAAGNPKTRRYAIGDVYYLSKRTWLYVDLVRQANTGGATAALNGAVTGPNAPSKALELGYVVSF